MVTLPVGPDPRDQDRVVPLTEQSTLLWQALKNDQEIPEAAVKDGDGAKTQADGVVK